MEYVEKSDYKGGICSAVSGKNQKTTRWQWKILLLFSLIESSEPLYATIIDEWEGEGKEMLEFYSFFFLF